ncbi:hypothetical protein RV14_GL001654 [Enterococcus ratti]|uniref:Uncharacterized protein n=1 Tax=Enterococcus ratti TaxID=150033 RepID=A0A1L8WQL2_9ENTE|nr:hypothetical protein RV14_GL001654 [Enterococcus ratti]
MFLSFNCLVEAYHVTTNVSKKVLKASHRNFFLSPEESD